MHFIPLVIFHVEMSDGNKLTYTFSFLLIFRAVILPLEESFFRKSKVVVETSQDFVKAATGMFECDNLSSNDVKTLNFEFRIRINEVSQKQ
jgi:hypothetical protein